jgi:hypothetical protein
LASFRSISIDRRSRWFDSRKGKVAILQIALIVIGFGIRFQVTEFCRKENQGMMVRHLKVRENYRKAKMRHSAEEKSEKVCT